MYWGGGLEQIYVVLYGNTDEVALQGIAFIFLKQGVSFSLS